MSDYIDRQEAIKLLEWWAGGYSYIEIETAYAVSAFKDLPPADVVPVVRCKDCVHQTKIWHNDRRMKSGGYYIYGCDLADEYSHVCLDDDFCSQGERMDGEQNGKL